MLGACSHLRCVMMRAPSRCAPPAEAHNTTPRSAPSFLVAPAASPPHRLVAGLAGRCFQIQVPAQGGGAGTHAGGGAPTTINAVRLVEAASGQCYLTSIRAPLLDKSGAEFERLDWLEAA